MAGWMHLPARRRHGVEGAVDIDRRRPHEVVRGGPEVVAPPDPRGFQIPEVVGVDLGQMRVGPGISGVSAQVAPLAVLGAGKGLGADRGAHREGCKGGDHGEREAPAEPESSPSVGPGK